MSASVRPDTDMPWEEVVWLQPARSKGEVTMPMSSSGVFHRVAITKKASCPDASPPRDVAGMRLFRAKRWLEG
ncbi:hypothetical protein MPLSOD_10273 [Mesorhizobium sp. SOD10]|nr:hypothetical protein MPLSOD_10273 [Mesorhizobium sp. SOD10]